MTFYRDLNQMERIFDEYLLSKIFFFVAVAQLAIETCIKIISFSGGLVVK